MDYSEVAEFYGRIKSIRKTADHFGIPYETVRVNLKRIGIDTSRKRKTNSAKDMDSDFVCKLYKDGHSIVEISKETNFQTTDVSNCLKENGVKIRKGGRRDHLKTIASLGQVYEMCKTKTYKEISEATGIKPSTIAARLHRAGFRTGKDITCPVCGNQFGWRKGKQYCSKQCKNFAHHAKIKYPDKRINKDNIIDADITLWKLYERDNGVCYICGKKTSFKDKILSNRGNVICGPTYPNIEHIIPLSRGGKHSWNNVKLACQKCNLQKGANLKEVI